MYKKLCVMSREEIISSFEPLVKKYCRRYFRGSSIYEDALQEGRIAVILALRSYREELNVPLEAYIRKAVIYRVRKLYYKQRVTISIDEENDESKQSIADTLTSETDIEEEYLQKERSLILRNAIDDMKPEYKLIITKFYLNNMSIADIADEKKCHYMSAVRLKKRALENLKQKLAIRMKID